MRKLVEVAKRRYVKDPDEPFCVLDRHGNLVDVDAAFPEMLGFEMDEIKGKPLVDFVYDEDVQRVLQEILAFRASKESTLHLETRMSHKRGGVLWLHWTAVAEYESGNAYAMVRDITNERQMHFALEAALTSAEQANRAKSEFLANMSHEIRTPLNAIIGFTELALDSDLTATQRDLISTIKSSGDHLLELITDVLDLSKIEAGAMEIENRAFSLREALESSLDVVKGNARKKGLSLDYFLSPGVPDGITGDSSRLKQILVNLLGNAVKFTESGHVILRCWVNQEFPLSIGFEIEDSGIGMTEQQIGDLFTPFHQADNTINRKFGGTGLGLSICKQLVAFMGGSITVASELGKGTSFNFDIETKASEVSGTQLPDPHGYLRGKRVLIHGTDEGKTIIQAHIQRWDMVSVEEDPDVVISDFDRHKSKCIKIADSGQPIIMVTSKVHYSSEDRPPSVQELTRPAKLTELHEALLHLLGRPDALGTKAEFDNEFAKKYPLKILIAEDNLINQKVIRTMLEKLGYSALIVDDGRKAATAACEQQYDLVLMDVQMPVMDGMLATKLIRKDSKFKPRIVAVTAHADTRVQEECLASGMNDVMTKPIRLSALAQILSNHKLVGSTPTEGIIDLPRWSEMSELFESDLKEMLTTFESDVRSTLKAIDVDPKGSGHKIKGAALTLGFQTLATLASDVERGVLAAVTARPLMESALQDALEWAKENS